MLGPGLPHPGTHIQVTGRNRWLSSWALKTTTHLHAPPTTEVCTRKKVKLNSPPFPLLWHLMKMSRSPGLRKPTSHRCPYSAPSHLPHGKALQACP
ncbi:hypothetical protein VULLAG_LOCUS12868 [Vulpes lagopus]